MSDLVASFSLVLDEWQEEVLRAALGERSGGDWAVRQIGVSTPRQNGKSMLIVARVLAGLLLFGEETIVVSAHRQDTAREVFFRLVQIIEDNANLNERIDFIARSEMREYIRMKSGQEVRFKSRSKASGRGFSCDCLLLDEAQILGADAWAAILPTMSARPNPQVWLLGTPPTPVDDGAVFARLRESAARETRLGWLEWSADEGDDLDDPTVWAKANPAYGTRILREAIEAERATMTDDQFAMERLGMWSTRLTRSVIPAPSWTEQTDEKSVAVDRFALGIEVGPDMAWASVALAGQRDDGDWHLELDDDQHTRGRGVEWLVPSIENLVAKNPQIRAVVADVAGPIKPLLVERGQGERRRWYLKDAEGKPGVEVTAMKVAELGAGCSTLLSLVVTGGIWHLGQPQLNGAALSAGKRPLGDTGMWVWSRKSAESDITQIQAGTYALIGAQMERPRKPARRTSTNQRTSGRRAVVL